MEYYHEKVETEEKVPARISVGGTGRDKLRYPLHWHHNLEFDLVLEGVIKGKVAGQPLEAYEGEIFFVNSGDLHETDASECEKLRSVSILLSDEMLREYCPELDDWYFILENGSRQQKEIAELMLQCADIQDKKREFYEMELAIVLRKIGMIMLRECRHKKPDSDSAMRSRKSTRRVKKAISYMEENYENTLSIQDMAEVMGMTAAYFSRFFHQSTGQTFHSYLTWIRLSHARTQLLESDATVTELAMDNGFPNVKSFIRAFSAEYGETPAKYRRAWERSE